jgi:hypothetical protein
MQGRWRARDIEPAIQNLEAYQVSMSTLLRLRSKL